MKILHTDCQCQKCTAPSSQYEGVLTIKSPALLQSRASTEFQLTDDILEMIVDTEALETWAKQHSVKMKDFILSGTYRLHVSLKNKAK